MLHKCNNLGMMMQIQLCSVFILFLLSVAMKETRAIEIKTCLVQIFLSYKAFSDNIVCHLKDNA